jgi:hypothetical protein
LLKGNNCLSFFQSVQMTNQFKNEWDSASSLSDHSMQQKLDPVLSGGLLGHNLHDGFCSARCVFAFAKPLGEILFIGISAPARQPGSPNFISWEN